MAPPRPSVAIIFAADWFSVNNTDLPAIANWQVVVDRTAAGNPLPRTSVERDVDGDNSIDSINDPIGPFGESRTRGISLYADVHWKTDWADFALDVHATRTMLYKYFVLGEEDPGGHIRDCANAVLQARRGNFTANWNIYARSGYLNGRETTCFKRWYGHDVVLQWRDVLGVGLDLTGGILNVFNRGVALDPSDEDDPDRTLDSDRGRTFIPQRDDEVVRPRRGAVELAWILSTVIVDVSDFCRKPSSGATF